MRKFQRIGEPDFLARKWETWGVEWEQRQKENAKAQFHWHQIDGQGVNDLLLPQLKKQTQAHCSFCDNFPVSPPSLDTIEHFRPKSAFPRHAYQWLNLYYCCMHCQQKGAEFDEKLLQPDTLDYEFDCFFCWDFTRGTLEPNPQASAENQDRARLTIKLYRLNEGHPVLRKRELHRRAQGKTDALDDFAYRNYVEPR